MSTTIQLHVFTFNIIILILILLGGGYAQTNNILNTLGDYNCDNIIKFILMTLICAVINITTILIPKDYSFINSCSIIGTIFCCSWGILNFEFIFSNTCDKYIKEHTNFYNTYSNILTFYVIYVIACILISCINPQELKVNKNKQNNKINELQENLI
jgi:hypothetical protein